MKQSEIQKTARNRLNSLHILGITPAALKEAKAEIDGVPSKGIPLKDIPSQGIPPKDTPTLSDVEIKSNFCKVDAAVLDHAMATMDVYEQSVYIRLYRLSYGYGRNWCTVGYAGLMKSCNLKRNGVVNAIKRLVASGWVQVSKFDRTKGTTYRIFLPHEVGVLGIPSKGIPSQSTPVKDIPTVPSEGIPLEDIPQLKDARTQASRAAIPPEGIPLKVPNIEDQEIDLSPIISSFYNKIGQTRISKEKRERAEIDFKELQKDGFDPEDIQFAVEWIVENAKEQPYDFSIIKHTIGQAIAAKKKSEAERIRQLEEERLALENQVEEERQAEEQKKMEVLKEALDPEDKAKLRERALKEIRNMEGIREAFINDILISTKENEILKSEMQN